MKIIGANITGSFILNNQDVTNTLQSSSVWSGSVAAQINSLNAASASLNSATASLSSATASLYAATASLNSATASLNTFTASAAITGSNTFNGNQIVSGSLTVTGSITTPGTLTAQTLVVQTITSSQDFVTGSTKFGSIISNTHQFTGSISVSGSVAVNDSNVILTNQTSSMSVATASFVANAQTASFVENAQTASFVTTAQTASFVILAQTASFVTTAQTASFVANAQSASNAVNAQTASLAQTASFVTLAQTASFVTTAQTASFVTTAQTASFVANAQSASNAVNAATASFVTLAQTASFVTLAQTASFVTTAQTASFVTLAQTASFVTTAQTASFVANAQSASNAVAAQTASFANSFTVANTLTAQTLVVQTITSSVDFVTGSTRFGSTGSNTHLFTGSVLVSGSIGIGLPNPTNKLEVQAGDIKINANVLSTASLYFGITGTNYGKIQYNDLDGSMFITTIGAGSGYDLNLGTKENIRLSILGNNGNVGIGTTNPSYKLHISGAFSSNPGLYVYGTTYGMVGVDRGSSASSAGVNYYTTGSQRWFTGIYENTNNFGFYNALSANFPMVITTGSNVGIGSVSPNFKLDVIATNNDTNQIVGYFGKTGGTTYGSTILRVARNAGTITTGSFTDSAITDIEQNSGGSGPFRFGSTYADTIIYNGANATGGPFGSIHFATSGSITMTVGGGTIAGRVGIGTIVPEGPLHIWGSSGGGYVGMLIENEGGTTNTSAGIDFGVDQSSTYNGVGNAQIKVINTNSGDNRADMTFSTYNGSTFGERLRIRYDGLFGVGTNSPNNRLSVNGNADFGTTSYSFNGPSQYGGLTFPRGQLFFSNTNSQNQLYIASNAYNNASGVFAYRNSTQPALAIGLDNGEFSFLTAGNGTADATISWTTVIAITNGGNVTMGGTGATKLQSGTTAQRPSAAAGLIRYNTSLAELEMSNGSNWGSLQTKVMLGSSPSNPAESANDIKTYYPNATNGFYWIRQTGSTATSAYCVFRDATGAEIAGGPWTVPIISNDANSNFSTNGTTAAATFLSKCQAIGINTPGRGMESSRTTTEVYGAWLAVKRTIWEAYTPFMANGNTSGGSVLRMPMININGEGGASAHRLIYNTSLSTHLPPNESGDACNASQLFCGWWSATDISGWRTNDNNVPGPEDWGPSDNSNAAYNGAGVQSTLTVCVYK